VVALRDPFDVTHQKMIRGKPLDYVSWSQVADRLDEAAPGWSFTVVQLGDDWCWGRLTLSATGQTFENIGYAENAEADWKKEVLKDAVSDALKRCAALAGIARYLYDKDSPRPSQRPTAPQEPPRRPELERRAEGLVGTITKGSPPVDLQYRTEIEPGPAFGFKLKAGRTAYQAVAIGPLADALAIAQSAEDMEGVTATVWGKVEMVPWTKKNAAGVEVDMPPYARIVVERVQTPGWTLPLQSDSDTVPMFDEAAR
jgi:hypothetical protein